MLKVGETAPPFSGRTAAGGTLDLSSLRGRPVVLYFFPKSNSLGCTRESIGFAHLYGAFRAQGIEVVGVSVDTVQAQAKFAEDRSLPFPLLADSDRAIARAYGVLGALGLAKRVTFLLDADQRVLEVVASVLPGPHVSRARARFLGSTVPAAPGAPA